MPFTNPDQIIDRLHAANTSPVAIEKRRIWYSFKDNYRLFGVETCPDARVIVDDSNTVIVRDINVAGPKEPYRRLFSDHHLPEAGVISHYSASLTKPGERPQGCGGADASWEYMKGKLQELGDPRLERYVKRIGHPDPLIQSLISASQIASLTGKSVTAMYYDHDSCQVEPLGWFDENSAHLPKGFKIHDIANGEYNPRRIYQNGLPSFTDHLPPLAEQFLDKQKDLTDKLSKIPNLAEKQAVQKPRWAILSSSVLPISVRYPGLFDNPGDAFVVSVPRQKAEDLTYISPEDRKIAFDQLAYAQIHANVHNGQPDKSFSSLDGLLIEFPSMQMSDTVARTLLSERGWADKWFSYPGKQIVLAAMTSGIAHQFNKFNP